MSKPNQPDQHTLANKQVHAKKKPRAHDEGEVAIRERGKDRDSSGSDNEGAADDVDLQPVSVVDDPSILRIGIMADSELTLGFLLAGIGYHREKFRSYLMVDSDTPQDELENFFNSLYRKSNMGMVMIDHNTAKRLKNVISRYHQMLPILLIVPTKNTLLEYLDKKDKKRRLRQRDAY
ncbi:uncharacterized protein Dana_GF20878 [Drosophila ananassae]|uniref:Uncharacterized protein n=1 Tax=Drosophila ananassae TaxID=7217 RepID=B3MS33_DROAN|nr:uncharacterized protein LOC6503570 [Drosophila ananassae]EDV34588.1 uncharacterized protein Dana_GF20878 [Drosophila ananassae]